MRIHPDRQTLILAGEPLPRRSSATTGVTSVAGRNPSTSGSPYVSGRADAAATDAEVTDAEYTPSADASTNVITYQPVDLSGVASNNTGLPATTPKTSLASSRAYSSYVSSSRGNRIGGASAYARTQGLSERHSIIDTYA